MSFLKAAVELADLGFHVFPLRSNSKLPLIRAFPERATRDHDQIKKWWTDPVMGLEKDFNIGISTSKFGDNGHGLLVVDVDVKDGDPDLDWARGREWGELFFTKGTTFAQVTPTGGRHFIFKTPTPVKQSVGVLGKGIDIRSKGGYIVGAGSVINGKRYVLAVNRTTKLIDAPQELIELCGKAPERAEKSTEPVSELDKEVNVARAKEYLTNDAPIAIEGQGGDATTYKVAATVKDFGISEQICFALLDQFWNPRCKPPWGVNELSTKIENAYQYGNQPPGVNSLEADFSIKAELAKGVHPVDILNRNYAFIIVSGTARVVYETTGPFGEIKEEFLTPQAFFQKLQAHTYSPDSAAKPVEIARAWMSSHRRRTYDGVCFSPEQKVAKNFYNLWRGFSVKPKQNVSHVARQAVKAYFEHTFENVCDGDPTLFTWLVTYIAHIIQKPYEKPLVALVFRGGKGVGKNAFINPVGHLLGSHYLLTSDKRYLTGHFNSHLEKLLLITLDEAFWSGDKQAEGVLKSLITGDKHVIERKGLEPYQVKNLSRVCVIGNEDWLVPASHDERRFAVFNVTDGKKQNRAYFQSMREGLEAGGYSELLYFLQGWDLKRADINGAPNTQALTDQKLDSLHPVHEWWYECLLHEQIIGGLGGNSWPETLKVMELHDAFVAHCRKRNISSRFVKPSVFGKRMRQCAPRINRFRRRGDEGLQWDYQIPSVAVLRKDWERFIGQSMNWEESNDFKT